MSCARDCTYLGLGHKWTPARSPANSQDEKTPAKNENKRRAMTPAGKQMSILTLLIFLATAANVWVFSLESEDTSQK
jgi:hypothetical protein